MPPGRCMDRCYPGTGFGICQGIVVLGEVVTAIGGYGLELMVGEESAQLSRGAASEPDANP